MASRHRHLIVILCLCLVIVGVSAGIKIHDQMNSEPHDTAHEALIPNAAITPKLDPSFTNGPISESPTASIVETSKPTVIGISGVTAVAYLVGNVKTGKIYLAKNSSRVLPVASMSKLVTAFVATDVLASSSTIVITEESASTSPDGSNLQIGESFSLEEILKPLLLSSSNVAAESIASSSDRKTFMELMRSYAWEVGMPHSFFADPSGISPKNVASAEDLFGLAKYLMYYRPDMLVLTRMASSSVATTTEHGSHIFTSTHPFVNDPRFIGGKTGRTEKAGETMLTMLDIDNQPIVFVILGARYGSRENDTRILLDRLLEIL